MIWLVLRVVAFVVVIAVAAYGTALLVDSTGQVAVTLNGVDYPPLTHIEFAALIAVAMLAMFLLYKLVGLLVALTRFFLGDETALTRFWARAKQQRGLDALSSGMVALAEGDLKTAQAAARKATRLLGSRDLTALLSAQVAEAQGDAAGAKRNYRLLAKEPETAIVGVKGLLAQAVKGGETSRAMKLAEHAFLMRPRDKSVQETLLDLQIRSGAWEGARETVLAMTKSRNLPRDVAQRREAVIDLEIARSKLASGARAEALNAADAAVKLAPALAPAAAFAARLHAEEGAQSKAARVVREAWRIAPHPELAHAFAEIAPQETASDRRQRFRELLSVNEKDPETKLLAAELALADADYAGARRAIGDLPSTLPTHRSLALMAAIEKGEGAAETIVRGYLARAVTAPRGAHWVCDRCGAAPGAWSALCPSCGGFDTLAWRDQEEAAEALEAAMLPLIVDGDQDADEKDEEDRLDAEAAEEALRESEEARA